MSAPASHSRRCSVDVALLPSVAHVGCSSWFSPWPVACCAPRVMNRNLKPSSPSSSKVMRRRVVEPLERRRPVEREARVREALADLDANDSTGSRSEVGNSHQTQVGDAGVQVAQRPLDRQVQAARRLRRVDRRQPVGAGDDHEVVVAQVVRHGARHAQLAHHLRRRDQRLAADVPAALGQHLVLDVRRRHAGAARTARSCAGR